MWPEVDFNQDHTFSNIHPLSLRLLYSPLSSKLRTMFPSRISFWFFGVPSETDTALKRSNINWGAFLWGATDGPRGKSFRWTNAFSFAVSSKASFRTAVPLSCGIASGLTHLSWRARTSNRRRAPAVILVWSGLSSTPVGTAGDKGDPLPLMTGCPCIQLTPGDDWAVIDDGGQKKHKGKVKMTRESAIKIKINKWLIPPLICMSRLQ